MLEFGILFLLGGGLTIVIGLIMLLVGAVESNKKKLKTAAYVLVGGALGLLVSFSLCSHSNFHI